MTGPRREPVPGAPEGRLPTLVVIGAMKCGTTSLHHHLDLHPDIAMSRPKELNFFFGPATGPPATGAGEPVDWAQGNWHRGPAWYAAHFDPAAAARGESSPGYTSPSHPEAAGRMAALIPTARLVYAVRDPIARAVSQYAHHRRDGTERRDLATALLDPGSQYVGRGRYFERLAPFLAVGPGERIAVVAQEELRADPRATLRTLFAHVGVDDCYWSPAMAERTNEAPAPLPQLDEGLRQRLTDALADDADRLHELAGRDFPGWSV